MTIADLTGVASTLIAGAGVVLISKQISEARRTSMVQASLETVLTNKRQQLSKDVVTALGEMAPSSANRKQLTEQETAQIRSDESLRYPVMLLLNHYEQIAIGIKRGGLDNEYFREIMSHSFRRTFWEYSSYISTSRLLNPRFFLSFEKLCREWDREDDVDVHFFTEKGDCISGLSYEQLPRGRCYMSPR